jgi:UDP-glucose 4-epimerase
VQRILENKNKNNYETFNLGTGKGVSVMEIIKNFEKIAGKKINYEIVNRRPGDIEKVRADTSLANNILGWRAAISLEETLKSAWEWEKRIRNI